MRGSCLLVLVETGPPLSLAALGTSTLPIHFVCRGKVRGIDLALPSTPWYCFDHNSKTSAEDRRCLRAQRDFPACAGWTSQGALRLRRGPDFDEEE